MNDEQVWGTVSNPLHVWPPKTVILSTGDGPDDTRYVISYDEMRRRQNLKRKSDKARKNAKKARRRNRR